MKNKTKKVMKKVPDIHRRGYIYKECEEYDSDIDFYRWVASYLKIIIERDRYNKIPYAVG